MPLENRPEILLLSPYLNCSRFELNDKTFISFFYCVLACVRHRSRCGQGRTRRRAVLRASLRGPDHDPKPEGQYLDQDFPEGFVNGKFDPIL